MKNRWQRHPDHGDIFTYMSCCFVFYEAKVEKNQAIFAGVQGGGMGMSRTIVRHFRKTLFPVFRDDFNFIVINAEGSCNVLR